jgi:hypothetical protein
MEKPKRGTQAKADTAKVDLKPSHAEGRVSTLEFEGPAEKSRAAINGETPRMNRSAEGGQGRVCEMKTKAFSFTRREPNSQSKERAW